MNERLFVFFAAVAEEMSFVRAASRLNIAQPWLSAQIKKLEERLGFQLFFRTKGQISLTPQGERLLPQARELADLSRQLNELARAISADVSDVVRLAAPYGQDATSVFGRLNDEFAKRYPQSNLEIAYPETEDLIACVRQGRASVALTFGIELPVDMDTILIHECRPYILLPAGHNLASADVISAEDLRIHKIATIRRNADPAFYDREYGVLLDQDIDLDVVPENGREAMQHYAERHGVGVLMIEGSVDDYTSAPGLVAKHLAFLPSVLHFFVRRPGLEGRSVERYWKLAAQRASAGKPS